MTKIKIVLADDHAVLRSGLRYLLNSQPDMDVVGEADSGEEALAVCRQIKPDILILDLSMPGIGGLEALGLIKAQAPEVKILVLTMHDDEGYLRSVLRAGGSGYIIKKAADAELLSAIRAVYRGQVFIDPSMTKGLIQELLMSPAKEDKERRSLSERELEVLRLVALGFTNKQIADELFLSIKTVESHKAKIKEKLNLRGRSELVRYAIQQGLLPADH